MTLYLSNRDGNGKTNEEGHYRFQTIVWSGNVLGASSLQVTQNSPLGMSVLIGTGDFKIDTSSGYSYTGWNTVASAQTISTSDPANPRITSVVIYVDKAAATSASPPNNPGIIKTMAVNGTAAAVPVAPSGATIQSAVGAGNPYIVLANVAVAAAATQIINANITDMRTRVTLGTDLVGTSAILDGAVTTNKLGALSVTNAKMANLSVGTANLIDKSVTAAKIEDQEAWITPTLINSWVNYGGAYETAGYYKDSLGVVRLKGLIKNGTVNNGATGTAFTLPVGYRPSLNKLFVGWNGASAASRIDVSSTGQVIITAYSSSGTTPTNAYASLELVSFRV